MNSDTPAPSLDDEPAQPLDDAPPKQLHKPTNFTVYLGDTPCDIKCCTCVDPEGILAYENFEVNPEGKLCAHLSTSAKRLKRKLSTAFRMGCTQQQKKTKRESKRVEPTSNSRVAKKKSKATEDKLSKLAQTAQTTLDNFMQGLQFVPKKTEEKGPCKANELAHKKEELCSAEDTLRVISSRLQMIVNRDPQEIGALWVNELGTERELQSAVVETKKQEYKELLNKQPKDLGIDDLRLGHLLTALKNLVLELGNPSRNTTSEATAHALVETINIRMSNADIPWKHERDSTLQLLGFLQQSSRLPILQMTFSLQRQFVYWLAGFCSSTTKHQPKFHQRASESIPLTKQDSLLKVKLASNSSYSLDDSNGHVPCTQYEFLLPSTAGPLFFFILGDVVVIRTGSLPPDIVKTVLQRTFFSIPQEFSSVDERRTALLEALRCMKYLFLHNYLQPFAFTKLVVRWLNTIDTTDHQSYLEDMIEFLTGIPVDVIPKELVVGMGEFCYSRGGDMKHDAFSRLDSFLETIGLYRHKWEKLADKAADKKKAQAGTSNGRLICGCGQLLDVCRGQGSTSTSCTK